MSYLLFVVYAILCCWLLTRIRFVKNAGLGTKIIVVLFLVKVVAGIANGWLMHRAAYLADTWRYHEEGLKEYQLLFSDPKEYFLNFFRSSYPLGYDGFFQTSQSYWNNLRSNVIIKLLSMFDIFSFGNYYVNVILYNFIIFFGNVGLYRVFAHIYTNKKWPLIIGCFLLPSLLFFSSSIHKEGLILAAIGIIVFNLYYALNYNKITIKKVIYIILSLCFIFFMRNYVLIAMLPAIFAWLLVSIKKYPAGIAFIVTCLIGAVLFFSLGKISSRLSIPEKIVQRQQDFLQLPKSNTNIDINVLQPTIKSFAANSPQAFTNASMRPYLSDISLAKYLTPFSIEILIYELLLLFFIFFRVKNKSLFQFNDPFILFGLFFCLPVFLLIGYTIPILGAIIRYRSIFLPFILVPVLCGIDWNFLLSHFQIKK